ncbi:hypothetical protein RAM_40195 [Amycolatopsis mediterranei S699]|nr:hypothetical protein RAM_40195 [Amycolatopsis mediterranei S699]
MLMTRAEPRDNWFYPRDIEDDLKGTDLPEEIVAETLACAWEYTRCVIPQFIDWDRYIAFTRIIVIGIIAEFRGGLVDVAAGDNLLGYDLDELLDTVFAGTPGHEEMAREYRTFLLITADKSSERCNSELFRRYVNALTRSPKDWFRLRDSDALARFTIAAAMACNDITDTWFSEEEFQILTELGDTLYDAVAYYKHRAEGETNSTFAYVGHELRAESYRRCREALWALDVAWARAPAHRATINFLRYFGGPIHMMMRRYRFTEEDLTIGRPETEHVVAQTRQNIKLWHRVDVTEKSTHSVRYANVVARSEELMFPGLADMLESAADAHCDHCRHRLSYGAEPLGRFGGVELCDSCRADWATYLRTFPARAAEVFPLVGVEQAIVGLA